MPVQPKKIDFYGLPRPVQERFAAATRRSAPPAPLLYARAPRTQAWASLGASAIFAVVAVLVLRAGLGDPASSLALHKTGMLAVDVVLCAASAYGVVHAMGVLRALDSLPWRPGTYLFPGCVVEAQGPVLTVWPVGDAEAVERVAEPSALAFRMRDGTRLVVPASSSDQAERANAALGSVRPELARAIAEEDAHVLAELDPLHDSAFSSPVGPTEKMKRKVLVSARFDWAIAIAVGVVVGLTLGETRNAMSDDAMFRALGPAAKAAAYRLYLSHGGKYSADVRGTLLPLAELRDAEAEGTVEAIQAFAKAHPASKIGPEIDAALHQALLVELAKAKRAGTVTALNAFAAKYPDPSVLPQLQAARHALFVRALDGWRRGAQVGAPEAAFMDRLLRWAEASGPNAEVRFRMEPSKTLDDADRAISHNVRFPGADALPSRYLTAEALRPREQRVAEALAGRFAQAFPADVLALRPGAPLPPDVEVPASPPTLAIDYTVDWAKGETMIGKPRTVFAGLIFSFDARFALPGGQPVKAGVRVWRGAETWRIKAGDMTREELEQKVYDMMIDGAFDQLGKKLADTFF